MRFGTFRFGSIEIDGVTYTNDVVIDNERIRPRRKGPSKSLGARFGHTPLTAAEDIPWSCHRLIVGSGAEGALPLSHDVRAEAARRGVELVVLPTAEAIERLRDADEETNAILHLTC